MKEETKKLIEEKKATWPDSQLGDNEIIWLSDLQKIIDSETKPLHDAIAFHLKTIRDEFAMRAPEEIPEWFPKSKAVDARTFIKISDRERYFKWRFYYADQMMKERGLGNQISTNLKSFIANCEDIPDDIKKVIDKEFFNML